MRSRERRGRRCRCETVRRGGDGRQWTLRLSWRQGVRSRDIRRWRSACSIGDGVVQFQFRNIQGMFMPINGAHGIRACKIQDRVPVLGGSGKRRWGCIRAFVQSDVELANVLQRHRTDVFDVGAVIILRGLDELVPYAAELVLELWQSTLNFKFANGF